MLRRLREMYQRSRLDREPDEIVVKDVEILDWKSDCIWDQLHISELKPSLWSRIWGTIKWLPIDIETRLEMASEDVAEYERGRWDERPSRWTYFLSFLYWKMTLPYQRWKRSRGGPLRRLRQRWRLFWGTEKLIETRIRLVNAGGQGGAAHPDPDPDPPSEEP